MLPIADNPPLRRFYWRWEKALDAVVPECGARILCALSGGCDSTVLAWLLLESARRGKCQLTLGHVNHQLRPEADADERHVRELAATWGVPLHTRRVSVAARAAEQGWSQEQSAREERYRALEDLASEADCALVAVAHQMDDQAETVLLRLLRGTGPGGLGAMRPRTQLAARPGIVIIRPLLGFRARELREIARLAGLRSVEDRSNEDPKHLRNRIRHQLMPHLAAEYNPRIVESLAALAARQQKEDDRVAQAAEGIYRVVRVVPGDEREHTVTLDARALAAHPEALVTRVLWLAYQDLAGRRSSLAGNHMQALLQLVAREGAGAGPATGSRDVRCEVHLPRQVRACLAGRHVIFQFHEARRTPKGVT